MQAISAGNYIEVAANYAGIDKQTLYTWLKLGNKQTHGRYRRFLDGVKKALADAEVRSVARIAAAGEKEWTAEAWRLERKNPGRWGRKDRLQANVNAHVSLTDLVLRAYEIERAEQDESAAPPPLSDAPAPQFIDDVDDALTAGEIADE